MIEIDPQRMASAMKATIAGRGDADLPGSAEIDSRRVSGGELFFGLPGGQQDGGRFAAGALERGAWGAVVGPAYADEVSTAGGWVFVAEDPLAAMQALATVWRRELGATVVGITGSVGKTSVKDITAALLPGAVHASPENFNTEIGLPLTILAAPAGTEVLVLEMAMRGAGQIAELARIAEPDIAVITNVGPVHIELLGSIEAIAAAKAELIGGLRSGAPVVVPVEAGYLEPHLESLRGTLRFGPGGVVEAGAVERSPGRMRAQITTPAGSESFEFPFAEDHNLSNALAAVAIGTAIDVDLGEMADRAQDVAFSRLRGEHLELDGGALVINDSYNANPVSMRAALDYLAAVDGDRRIAVLGLMAELGAEEARYHAEVGGHARELGIDVVVGVGPVAAGYEPDHHVDDPAAAAELLSGLLGPGTAVLVKGSRAAGLEAVAEALASRVPEPNGPS